MDDSLTRDELDALDQIGRGLPPGRPSACVARNSKRLVGLKYIAHGKHGNLVLTDKARQSMFVKSCIDGLRAAAADSHADLAADVATFLGKKGHITLTEDGGYAITPKGRDSLADIDAGGE